MPTNKIYLYVKQKTSTKSKSRAYKLAARCVWLPSGNNHQKKGKKSAFERKEAFLERRVIDTSKKEAHRVLRAASEAGGRIS